MVYWYTIHICKSEVYLYVYIYTVYMYVYNAVCNWESSICHEAGTLRNKDIHKRNTNG